MFYSAHIKSVFFTVLFLLHSSLSFINASSALPDVDNEVVFLSVEKDVEGLFDQFAEPLNLKNLSDIMNMLSLEIEISDFVVQAQENFDQEILMKKGKAIESVITLFHNSCDQKTVEFSRALNEIIVNAIKDTIEEANELAVELQTLNEQLQKGKKDNPQIKSKIMLLQKNFEAKTKWIEEITRSLKMEIYKTIYSKIEAKCKKCLVKKVSLNGVININKRTEQVYTPEQAKRITDKSAELMNKIRDQLIEGLKKMEEEAMLEKKDQKNVSKK